MSDSVRTSGSGPRLHAAGGLVAAGSAGADLLSIMYWVDGIVAEYVAHPELPDRETVIARATAIRADCRELAQTLGCSARLAPLRRGSVVRFPGRTDADRD